MTEAAPSGPASPRGTRYASVIKLRPEHADEYLRLHRDVWPDVLAMITACNIRNYSIYKYGDLLFGYYEYIGEDHAADMARMAADPTTQRWWQLTDPCQEQVPGARPGEWWTAIPEAFHHD
jgi:L-rhamnose mutarotase